MKVAIIILIAFICIGVLILAILLGIKIGEDGFEDTVEDYLVAKELLKEWRERKRRGENADDD